MRTSRKAADSRALAAGLFAMVLALFTMHAARADGPWIAQPNWNMPADSGQPALADINGDGKLDLLFGQTTTGTITAYQNTGTNANPSWTPAPSGWTTLNGTASCTVTYNGQVHDDGGDYKPALGDIDGDGDLDLVIGTRNTICVYENTGTSSQPTWTYNAAWGFSGLSRSGWNATTLVDVDGDGKLDLLASGAWFKNTGTGTAPNIVPAWTQMTGWGIAQYPRYVSGRAVGDLDGDGRLDQVLSSSYGYIYAYPNVGTATAPSWTNYGLNWSLFPAAASALSSNSHTLFLADLNGDGKPDLLSKTSAGMTVYYQSPSGMGAPYIPEGPPSVTGVTTETFDSFSCPGSWQSDPTGPNNSYSRYCSDGWTAYAEDMSNTLYAPDPFWIGPVGDQNVVALDNTANGPSAAPATPLGSALLHTAPDVAQRGVLWLLKTYPVTPGTPVQVLKADIRTQYTGGNEFYSLWVFDGKVTSPYGVRAGTGAPSRSDVLGYKNYSSSNSATCAGIAVGSWCPWQAADLSGLNNIVPTSSYITVAFRVEDTSTSYAPTAEIDNLSVSNVTTSASPPVPTNDLAQLWSTSYQAGGTDNMSSAADIVTDGAGNSYVTGTFNNGTNYDIVTVKYDDTGTPVSPWPVTFNGASDNDDQAVAMAIDGTGDIDIVGRSYNGTDNDFVVLKYDPNGNLLWSNTYDNAGNDDVPTALAVDASGNVFATGRTCSATGACDYATVAYTAAGAPLWSSASLYDGGDDDEAVGMKLDSSGNVYITGNSFGTSDDIVTVKYNSAGVQQWVARYDSGNNDLATALTVDGSGTSYVTGYSYNSNGGSPNIVVLKYGPGGGSPLWAKTYGGGAVEAMPSAMIIDGSGSVYITGRVGQVSNYDMVTLKYLTDGTLAWVQTYGNSGLNDWGTDLALDSGGTLYVLGAVSPNPGNTNFVTVKYDSSGVATDAITYDGSNVADIPTALALGMDIQGDTTAYVVGTSTDSVTGLDHMQTVRYEKALPDLTMTQLSGPTDGVINGTIGVVNAVLNIDDVANKIHVDSGVFTVSYYLAPDVSGSPDLGSLALIGSRDITNLAPGQSDAPTTTLTIPSVTPAGDYFLVARADSSDTVVEADETNNQLVAASPITIAASDLVVSDISAPTTIDHTQPFDVSVTVTDLVSAPTPSGASFRVGVYLSTYPDSSITTSDTLIGSYTLSDFSGLSSVTTTVTIPANTIAPGQYYIGAIVDDQNAILEADETNNSAVLQAAAGNDVLLTSDTDFNAGLGVTDTITSTSTNNVAVVGSGTAAAVFLAQDTSTTVLGWSPQSGWTPPGISYGLADLDNDGLPDLLTGSTNGNANVYVYKNTGTASAPVWTEEPTWETNTCHNFGFTGQYSHPRVADLNGDNIPDLVVATRDMVCVYQNTGTGLPGDPPVWSRNTAWESGLSSLPTNRFYKVALGDMDNDGKVDMMLNGAAYQNTGTATVPAWTAVPAWNLTGGGVLAMGDVDGDGKIDIFQGQSAGGEVFGYQNTGTGLPGDPPVWTANISWDITGLGSGTYTSTAPELGDIDGDGRLDLLVENAGTDKAFKSISVPPYYTSGTYISNVIDAGVHGGFTTLSYTPVIPPHTTVDVAIRAGDVATPDNTWTAWASNIAVNGDISSLGTNRYIQYRFIFHTDDVTVSPEVDSIEAHKLPPGIDQYSVVSVLGDNSSGGGDIGAADLLALMLFTLFGRLRGRAYGTAIRCRKPTLF